MEVEVKAFADDLDAVEKKLKQLGAKQTFKGVQLASYYALPGRQTEGSGFVLRIRSEKKKSFLTLKKASGTPGAWIEHETAVGNSEETRKILLEAGFQKFLEVNKTRTQYFLEGVTYCLDEVDGLGRFVEVEKIGEDAKTIHLELEKILASLGLTKTTKKGYVAMLEEKNAGKQT